MKLVYITNIKISKYGAQSLQTYEMCRAFSEELTDNFLLISPGTNGDTVNKEIFNWKKIFTTLSLSRALSYALFIKLSLFTVIKFKPDIIYTRDIGVAFFYRLVGFICCYEIHKPFETFWGNLLFKLIHGKIRIVSISHSLKNFIIATYKVDEKNILVAHDGVDLERFKSVGSIEKFRKEVLGHREGFIVLYSGTFQKGKGIDILEEASEKLKKENFFFVFLGAEHDKEEENKIYIQRKPQEEIPDYLKIADVLVIPNTSELKYYNFTSPLKLFEYLAAGKPILSSPSDSIREVVGEHEVYFFYKDSVDSFCERLLYIKNNYGEALDKTAQYGEMITQYDWKNRADKIIEFLKTEL